MILYNFLFLLNTCSFSGPLLRFPPPLRLLLPISLSSSFSLSFPSFSSSSSLSCPLHLFLCPLVLHRLIRLVGLLILLHFLLLVYLLILLLLPRLLLAFLLAIPSYFFFFLHPLSHFLSLNVSLIFLILSLFSLSFFLTSISYSSSTEVVSLVLFLLSLSTSTSPKREFRVFEGEKLFLKRIIQINKTPCIRFSQNYFLRLCTGNLYKYRIWEFVRLRFYGNCMVPSRDEEDGNMYYFTLIFRFVSKNPVKCGVFLMLNLNQCIY